MWRSPPWDAATGATLLDTLVNPGCPVQPGAQAVHGITGADVAGAPPWSQVLPELLTVTRGRTVLAYNAAFDSDVMARHTGHDGLDPGHLAGPGRWACLMGRRSAWALRYRWLPLGGGLRPAVRHDRPRPPAQSNGTPVTAPPVSASMAGGV